jgi:uncharacterized hydantoinase/oxoprolinase family protein
MDDIKSLPAKASASRMRDSAREMVEDAAVGVCHVMGTSDLADAYAREAIEHGCLTISWGKVKITPKGREVADRAWR